MAAGFTTLYYTMASLYRRKGSRFWYIEFVDIAGKRRCQSTKLRWDVPTQNREAMEFRRKMAEDEKYKLDGSEVWDAWVPRFLEHRYGPGPVGTLERNRGKWRNISAFLRTHGIHVPRMFTRQHAHTFIQWRQARHTELGVFEVCKNTAIHEIKLLRVVMFEAVASGFAASNPCARLWIKMDTVAKKPRITDAEHAKILKALAKEPDWMRISYLIAWHQGARFSETCVALDDVDFAKMVIGFRTKGHKDSVAEFPLAPALVPMLREFKAEGRRFTFEMPAMPGKLWWKFFRRNKLGHLCFHCTRVSFITRAYEAGIPRDMVMRLAGHTTTLAHEIYPRLTASNDALQSIRKMI